MPSFTLTAVAAAAIALFANTASAHLTMQKPVPFGVDSLDNSPLEDAFPGNYPCKQRPGVYDISKMNEMPVGTPQELSFEGSASHGGGTCQLAVSLDKEPTADSVFKIIQVFEGGCPTSSDGNSGTKDFSFKIPEGFPNGVATFAWYWNNKIGNREAYMNCAPITVSGGSDGMDVYNSLPGLFLANLPSSDCEVPESASLEVPNAGQYVVKGQGEKLIAPSGPKCAAYAAKQMDGAQGAPAGNSGGSSPAPTSAPAAAPSGGSPPAGGSYGGNGGNKPPASSAPAQVTLSTAISSAPAAATSAPASYAPAPSGAASPSGSSSGSGSYGSGSSSSSGSSSDVGIECSPDGAKFGMTTAGGETIWQPVASGTKCQNGGIVKRDAETESDFRNPHVRRHAGRAARMHKQFEF